MLSKLKQIAGIQKHSFQYKNYLINLLYSRETYSPRQRRIYKRILDDYWIPVSRAKRFHLFNEVRVPLIYNTYIVSKSLGYENLTPKEEFKNVKMLVVGCGGGIGTEALAELNFNVTGIDPNPDLIVIAKDHQQRTNLLRAKSLQYFNTSVEEFSETNVDAFDAVVISDVLEYIPYWNKQPFLQKCIKCCKVGGRIFITTFNCSLKMLVMSLLFDTEPNFNAIPFSSTKGITPEALSRMLDNNGCIAIEMRGITFNPLQNKFMNIENLKSWYFTFAVKKE